MTITHSYTVPSPAKLNLFLHVNGQRADGYHELQTLFQFIDYSDTLTFTPISNKEIILETPLAGVKNQDNLIVKAAQKLMAYNTTNQGVSISIDKKLPMGGGLGGGSSNAATVLLTLNKLWHINLPLNELAKIALDLGADVPIFIHGFSAFAEGVGEKIIAAHPEENWYLITKPNCSISTAEVFASKELPRNTPKLNINNIVLDNCANDCEQVVIKHYPDVANLMARLVEYAPSRMTGTGACIFSRFNTKQEACRIQSLLPKTIESFVAKGLNKSPVHSIIENIS